MNEENEESVSNTNKESEYKKHLLFLEDSLQPELLEDFKNAFESNISISTSDNKGLFDYWTNLRRLSG